MKSNLHNVIFQSILWEEKHDLTFHRVLYFLPHRGALEFADEILHAGEIQTTSFWVKMFMIVIATNGKENQMGILMKKTPA